MNSVLKIVGQGAWNGGVPIDNSVYENIGMFFKGGIPVNNETIEQRVGVRTRMAAPPEERIGVNALQDLLETYKIDRSRIKLVIGATNVGDDVFDPGPLIKYPFRLLSNDCQDAVVFDLYAGCPGFNVSVELILLLSLAGVLKKGDISIIVGAENIHRAKPFKPLDTSNIIFGDDAMATALETGSGQRLEMGTYESQKIMLQTKKDMISEIAEKIFELAGKRSIDGIIVDNQLGKIYHRIPSTSAKVQHHVAELMYPDESRRGTFTRFKNAISFYDDHIKSFAFDIMSHHQDPGLVERIARAYVESGKYGTIASVYLEADLRAVITIHRGQGYQYEKPREGIIDSLTRTHGCFADYIIARPKGDREVFAEIDGKGVFLYATRGARAHLDTFLSGNNLNLHDVDLLIEHQANFAMIPLMLEQLFLDREKNVKKAVADYISNKMIMNIHERGNCSVVCMQRLPYDLKRDVLREDIIQGYAVNRKLDQVKDARIILYDSIGAGMTRSSLLQINGGIE